MKIDSRILSAAARRAEQCLPKNFKSIRLDYAPSIKRPTEPQELFRRGNFLVNTGAKPSATELERLLGTNDLVDEFYLLRALLAAQPVARVVLRSPGGHEHEWATGFMVSPRLLLTNRHVLVDAEAAASGIAEFNYCDDIAGNPLPSHRYSLRPDLFFFNHLALDFALVSVESTALQTGRALSDFGYHRLIATSGKVTLKEWMTIIQYPSGQRRQYAIRENECIADSDPNFLWYRSDTAPGSSGAPVFNDSFQVVALHHSGRALRDGNQYVLKDGRKVSSLDEVDDSEVNWIANEGVRISRLCETTFAEAKDSHGHLDEFHESMKGGDILSRAYQNPTRNEGIEMNNRTQTPAEISTAAGVVNVPVNLDLRITLFGQPLAPTGTIRITPPQDVKDFGVDPNTALLESFTFKEPIVDKTHYPSRKGFNAKFLGVNTPLPTVLDKTIVSKMQGGKYTIPYEHFTVVMNKTRRLALYTASNVDGRPSSKQPEPGNYTRSGLTGLGKYEVEQWVLDPRIPAKEQLPDVFYNNDRKAFDKGHIVRREDVCWGTSYAQVQRANGDTYHSTNCSPQVAGYNESGLDGLWGELENFILKQAKTETYSLFAGPVLNDADPIFNGKDNDGNVQVKIPRSFWKIVMAVKNGKLQAFGFLLEQDLSKVEFEFAVDAKWKTKATSLKDLENKIRLLRFSASLHTADQF